MAKLVNEEVYKILQSQNEIAKINTDDLIKEAISSLPKKEDEEEEINRRKISEYLNNVKEKTLKEFLLSIHNKKVQQIKDELGNQMDKYNKSLYNLIIKVKLELQEEKKKSSILIEETKNLNNKINKLNSYNKVLLSKIKEYENNLLTLQKNYSMLSSQKNLFNEIMDAFPGKTPAEIINELKIAKKGSTLLLESFANMNLELVEMKKSQKDLDKIYNKKINNLTNENDQLLHSKKEEREKYIKIVNELKNKMEFNQNKIKESDYLRNTLYHIYNILFERLNLVKDIKINEKYKGLTEQDFNPDVLYDPELVSYIELMVKKMYSSSYDKMIRECIGYLNMIIRNYLPDKKKLRFKPVEIFREITNFIDLKMKSIEEYKNIIKHYKANIHNMQLNLNKTNEKYESLSKEYESYKILVEKNIEKNNKDYSRNREEKKMKLYTNNVGKIENINLSPTKKRKKGIILNDFKFSFNSEPSEHNSKNKNKLKKRRNFSQNKKRIMSAYKGNSLYNRYYYNIKNKSEKNILNKNPFNSFERPLIKLDKGNKMNTIIKHFNSNKLIKENGNQENINYLKRINGIIDETNRLFLYQPRMASFQKKFKTIDDEEKIVLSSPDINSNLEKELYEKKLIKTYEGKIIKNLNNLIKESNMN